MEPLNLPWYLGQIVTLLIGIIGLDRLLIWLGDDPKQTTRRWYLVHAIVNGLVVCLSFSDLIRVLSWPLASIESGSLIVMATVISLHLYHIICFFWEMDVIDWMHHLVSVVLVGALSTFFFRYRLLNFMLFFMCGLPGGIDYLLLALRKYGFIEPLTEKGINVYLNMWIRLPGILFVCYTGYFMSMLGHYPAEVQGVVWIMILLNSFNGIYFATRVVKNYGESLVKHEHFKQRQIQRESLKRIPSVGRMEKLSMESSSLEDAKNALGMSRSRSYDSLGQSIGVH